MTVIENNFNIDPLILEYKSLERYSKHFIFFITYEWSNKLECHITLHFKGQSGKTLYVIRPIR